MIWEKLSKHQDIGLLIARVGIGLGLLFFHGWGKLVAGPERWTGLGGAMSNFGIDFGHTFFGFMAAFAESIGGIMIAAGLFFRPMCLIAAFTMFVAMMQHFISGQGNAGHAFKNLFVLVGLMFVGPGKYSIDAFLLKKKQR